MSGKHTFWGYRRANGTVGIRNHVAILAVTDSVNGVVRHLGQLVKDTLPTSGCSASRG